MHVGRESSQTTPYIQESINSYAICCTVASAARQQAGWAPIAVHAAPRQANCNSRMHI